MIRHSIKLLLVLVLLLFCPDATDSHGGDCDDPFSGSSGCQTQDLADNDEPPGGEECGGPIVVTGSASAGNTLSVTLSNPSGTKEQAFIVAQIALDGRQYQYVVPISVSGGSGLNVIVTFPGTVTTISVHACSNRPGGINEGPDVVAIRHEEEQEEQDGEQGE